MDYAPGFEEVPFTGTAGEFVESVVGSNFSCRSRHIRDWELPREALSVVKRPDGWSIQTAPGTYLRLEQKGETYRLYMPRF